MAVLVLTACGGAESESDPDASSVSSEVTSSSWVYRDALQSPWKDWSWASHSLTSTSKVFAGTRSISMKPGPWQALYFAHTGFSTAGRSTFSLAVNGGATDGAALRVRAVVNGSWTTGTALGPTCTGGAVRANAWTRCDVPLSAIAPAGAKIEGIAVQEDKGKALPTMYFDEIGFDVSAGSTAAVSVAILPATATLAPGESKTFTAAVTGSTATAVTWSVSEGALGGAVTSAGKYTAPSTQGTYHVVATSQADTTKSATATVTVTASTTDPDPGAGSSVPTNPISFTKNKPFTLDSGTTNHVYVPTAYDSTHETPMTLFVWLHGCGGASSGDIWVVSPGGSQSWISLAPGGAEGKCWNMSSGPAQVLAAIADVKTHFNVNPKRVILGGYSSGGDLTYRTAFYNAGLFAGVLTANCSPFREAGATQAAVLGAASWKFNVVHLAHLQDTTFLIADVRAETDAIKAAGHPMTRIEVDGNHWDNPGAMVNGHAVPGTNADIANDLFPYLNAGWTAP